MINNQVLLSLLSFCSITSIQFVFVRGSGKKITKDKDIYNGLEDVDRWKNYDNFSNSGTTSSDIDSLKRSRENDDIQAGKLLKKKRPQKIPNYYKQSNPISAEVDSSKIELLRNWETYLVSTNTRIYKWDLSKMDDKIAKDLCHQVWITRIPKIRITKNMIHDCDPSKLSSASDSQFSGKKYQGYFYYLEEGVDNKFSPDLLRCNCAYVRNNSRNQPITVSNTKEFFFLFTRNELVYFVATIPPEYRLERIVRIVDVLLIPLLQECST